MSNNRTLSRYKKPAVAIPRKARDLIWRAKVGCTGVEPVTPTLSR